MESVKNQLWTDKPRNFFGIAINFTRYIITSEKFITRKGFFNIHEDEIMLYRITDKKLFLGIDKNNTIDYNKDRNYPQNKVCL